MKTRLAFFCILITSLSFPQGPIKVQLTRKIYPIMNLGRNKLTTTNDTIRIVAKKHNDSLVHLLAGYNLVGGDFADGKVKFAIVVNLPTKSDGEYMITLAPFGTDSVMVLGFMSRSLEEGSTIESGKLIAVKAMGIEYSASINRDGTEITMQQLFGNYEKPDIQLYDSLMPDGKFTLFNGGTSTFAEYKHQNKYIYIVFWNNWQPDATKEIDDLKMTFNGYKDALTIISFHSPHADTAVIKRIQQTKKIDWIEAKDGFDGEDEFPGYSNSGGILFDSSGKAVAVDIRPDDLHMVLEKLLHIRE